MATDPPDSPGMELAAIGLLREPLRRALYEHVGAPVARSAATRRRRR